MFIAPRKHGFTLLEVMVTVFIMALLTISIYRFIEGCLTAISFSRDQSSKAASVQGLVSIAQHQLTQLRQGQPGVLTGFPHKYNNVPSDEITWICSAGNGMLTRFAAGDYEVTLILLTDQKTGTSQIGMRRRPARSNSKESHWMPLLNNVKGFEVRYYEPRLSAWLEKWTDPNTLPTLVRFRIWQADSEEPYESVLKVPVTNPNRGMSG
jgi:prepilin-type N-terminal cleavage/methylation domain-containing protein